MGSSSRICTPKRRVLSIANATLGVIHAASLSVHAIGLGLARAEGLDSKHAIKQVDRLLSNPGVNVWELFAQWVPLLLAKHSEAVVALDWTDFDKDNQSTIVIHLITSHGRATPLVWKTVVKSELKGWRNAYEDEVIERLLEVVPPGLKVTLLADRGFGDQKLFDMLKRWDCDFVIRFREIIAVTNEDGDCKPAGEWVPSNGRGALLRNAQLTQQKTIVPAVVCLKARGMKDAWCLAASSATATAAELVKLYSRRFTIEESFRDSKNPRLASVSHKPE